jgi:glucan 1,3-beta-glucosidase
LNEPRWDVPIATLKTFYQDAYGRIRRHAGERIAIVFHDAFRPMEWKGFMTGPQYANVLLDTHLYQAYTDEDRKRTIPQHVAVALDRKNQIEAMGRPPATIVGEWSIALPGEVWRNQSPFQISVGKRAYGDAQLLSYETSKGWFYWSYKLEDQNTDWNFRHCVEQGKLPGNFAV